MQTGDGQGPDAYLARQPYFQKMKRFLVHETAVHWVDTFRYLLGDIKAVYADLRKMNPVIAGEDAGTSSSNSKITSGQSMMAIAILITRPKTLGLHSAKR